MTRLLLGWVIINVNVDLRQDNTRGQHKWSVNSGSWRNILTEAWSWQKYNFELSRLSSVSCPSQCWTSQYVVHHNLGHYSMLDITMSDITILDISVCCPSQFGTLQYVGHHNIGHNNFGHLSLLSITIWDITVCWTSQCVLSYKAPHAYLLTYLPPPTANRKCHLSKADKPKLHTS